ncbi:MAG TPA: NAD-binding protein [Geobacterales bacterium]|nr:NAD-binding protein [Geobacterales bacterium]
MQSVFFITIRRLRAPLILIILIFALSTMGLSLIPGVDAQGQAWRMTLFEAFYFVTYTATTIGFGEIPNAFTNQQRLFVTLIIYLSVIGWAYLLGSLLGLSQDKAFQQAIVSARFRRSVARLREPFYLVCGLGETGMTVVRALDMLGHRFTAIDRDERKIQELEIEDLSMGAPLLVADARSPETLAAAGLLKPECKGVLTLSNDDAVNLAVAVSACLLRPGLPVVGRADSPAVASSMSSLGTYRVINPFREFGEHMELAMRAPDSHRLLSWLTSTPGSYLPPSLPPRIPAAPGHWIVCGYGRFGNEVVAAVQRGGFKATIIDPAGIRADGLRSIKGLGTGTAVLSEAGVETASGIFAGTDDDTTNLAISIAARRLNPGIFVIVRQNLRANQMLFARFGADMTMVSSQIIANECIAVLRTPLLAEFLDLVRHKDDFWAYSLAESLRALMGEETPGFWSFSIDDTEAPGLFDLMHRIRRPVSIGDLCRSAKRRDDRIPCLALLAVRGTRTVELPNDDFEMEFGDRFLFAGQVAAEIDQSLMLQNANVAAYVLGARSEAEGWVWRKFEKALAR